MEKKYPLKIRVYKVEADIGRDTEKETFFGEYSFEIEEGMAVEDVENVGLNSFVVQKLETDDNGKLREVTISYWPLENGFGEEEEVVNVLHPGEDTVQTIGLWTSGINFWQRFYFSLAVEE